MDTLLDYVREQCPEALRTMTPRRRAVISERMDAAREDYIAGRIEDGDAFEAHLDDLIGAFLIASPRWGI